MPKTRSLGDTRKMTTWPFTLMTALILLLNATSASALPAHDLLSRLENLQKELGPKPREAWTWRRNRDKVREAHRDLREALSDPTLLNASGQVLLQLGDNRLFQQLFLENAATQLERARAIEDRASPDQITAACRDLQESLRLLPMLSQVSRFQLGLEPENSLLFLYHLGFAVLSFADHARAMPGRRSSTCETFLTQTDVSRRIFLFIDQRLPFLIPQKSEPVRTGIFRRKDLTTIIQSRVTIPGWGGLRAIGASNGWRAIEWKDFEGKKKSGFAKNSLVLLEEWSERWK